MTVVTKPKLNPPSLLKSRPYPKPSICTFAHTISVLIIDEFDHLFSKSADKDPYDLFIISQSPDVKIIGISNDIEFLQSKSKKLKLNLPLIRNIILKPYSKE